MQVRIENVLQVTPATFWDILFFDEDYNTRLYEELGFETYEIRAIEQLGEGRIKRTLRAEPPLNVPAVLKKALKSRLFYEEEGIYDGPAQRWEFTSVSSIAPEAAKVSGVITSAPHPEGMLHVVELELNVSALGLGGMIERVIERNTRESYKTTTRFTNEYARAKGLQAAR